MTKIARMIVLGVLQDLTWILKERVFKTQTLNKEFLLSLLKTLLLKKNLNENPSFI